MRLTLISLAILCGCRRTDHDAPSSSASMPTASELGHPVVAGTIHSENGALGTWDVALNDCQSGEYKGFFGADFFVSGTNNIRLRYVHDEAAGEVIKIFYPNEKNTAAVFNRNDTCSVLEGTASKMKVRTRVAGVGDVRHVEGHVKFDCTYDDGGHVTGEVTFSHCH